MAKIPDDKWIDAARQIWASDFLDLDLEIDDKPKINRGANRRAGWRHGSDPGAWVAAWVWVPYSSAKALTDDA